MKRFLSLIFALSFIINAFSQGSGFSKWSVTGEYGLNLVLGDYIPEVSKPLPPTYGLTIENAFTPIYGLSVDYYSFPYKGVNETNTVSFTANLQNVDMNFTINFTKMIFPNINSKLTVNGSLGIGAAKYSAKYSQNVGNRLPITDSITTPKYISAIPVSFLIEYNMSKSLALGLRIHYRAYMTDNLEGAPYLNWKGSTNDYISAINLSVRYKIGATSKNHLRNMTMKEYEPNELADMVKATADKVNKLGVALTKLEKKVDNQGRRIDSMQVFFSNDGKDSDGDGVPDQRDRSPNTPPNTAVDFWGVPIPVNNNVNNVTQTTNKQYTTQTGKAQTGKNLAGTNQSDIVQHGWDDIPTVYFEFDRLDLDNDALETIGKVAAKLDTDKGLLVEVRGYCDFVGNNPYNEKLSLRRAERVKAEMVKMWNISPDRIIVNGKGKILEPRVKYRPNRRCDLFFSR